MADEYPACNCYRDDGNPRWARRDQDKCAGAGRFNCRGGCKRRVPRCYRKPGTVLMYTCRDCEEAVPA